MDKDAKLIIEFPVVIPGDYSIAGFRYRNPDNFYQISEEMIDRHFQPSYRPEAGTKLTAEIYELSGEWLIESCMGFIEKQSGLLPNAVGLTLAFEQGERYLLGLKRPWSDKGGEVGTRSQLVFGLDTEESLWRTIHGKMLPCLYKYADALQETRWKLGFENTQLLGKKEDCLLLFREK